VLYRPTSRFMLAGAALVLMVLAAGLTGCGGTKAGAEQATTTSTTQFVLPLSDDACLGCHADFESRTADEDRKVFSHDLHRRQKITCASCHSTVGHDGSPTPDRTTCDRCHGVTMPHPADYDTSHGQQVLDEGSKVCATCHNVFLHCQFCHGLQMPHPEDWERKHGDLAVPELSNCRTCHDQEYCLQCHPVEMPHPASWTSGHGAVVYEKGSEVCTDCHEPELCTPCHAMPMPHPDDWGTAHPQTAATKRAECHLCHDQEDCDTCHEIHRTHGQGGAS